MNLWKSWEMKKLLLAALLILSLNVSVAGVVAEVVNQGGGSIALTDIKCKNTPNTFIAYTYISNGKSLLGCWAADDYRVFVRWDDGDVRSYPLDSFSLPKNKQPKNYM